MCTTALIRAIQASGREVGAYIYDGVLVRREVVTISSSSSPGQLPETQLEEWAAAVKAATGFTIQLAEKPMEVNPIFLLQAPLQLAGPSSSAVIDTGASISSAITLTASSAPTVLTLTIDDAERVCSSLQLPRIVESWHFTRPAPGVAKLVPCDNDTCLFTADSSHACANHNCCIIISSDTIMVCSSNDIRTSADRSLLKIAEAALPASDSDDGDNPTIHLRLVRLVSTQCDSHMSLLMTQLKLGVQASWSR